MNNTEERISIRLANKGVRHGNAGLLGSLCYLALKSDRTRSGRSCGGRRSGAGPLLCAPFPLPCSLLLAALDEVLPPPREDDLPRCWCA